MFYFNIHLHGQGYDVVSYWWEIQQIYKYFLCTSSENWFYKIFLLYNLTDINDFIKINKNVPTS